nr:enoyl-[acyl-carrier-protein] reductase [NADH], chloroplastic-like [Ipomoea batatas]
MSSAKSSLESDTRVLAFEAGRKHKVRVNTISAEEVGNATAFLASPLASAIMGAVVYVDNGLNAMGVGVDSPVFKDLDNPKDKSHETVKQAVSV